MAKPSPATFPRLLVAELWGLGDLALALPFLQVASQYGEVTLLAKPHAAPLLRRFAPGVELVALDAPWTGFRGKYRLHRWPWRELARTLGDLRDQHFTHAVSARPDPREHLLLRLARPDELKGFARAGSGLLLSQTLPPPSRRHRSEYWQTLASSLGWALPPPPAQNRSGRHVVIHTGAAQPVRRWPRERFDEIASRLCAAGWEVTLLDPDESGLTDLDPLLDRLAAADRFIGNDSGPGHIAALLGVPTFTIFGPQLPECFAPTHPRAAWIEGAPCPYKPCRDYCRFKEPHCLHQHSVDTVSHAINKWLNP